MRRTTITILAVTAVSLSTAACGGASETVGQQPTRQTLAGDPSDTTAGDDKPATPSEATSPPATDPTPGATQDPKPAPACDFDALNSELSNNTVLEGALQQHEHFRCLCDDQGYPLVGNINSKGTKASEFCTALKEKGLL